MLNRMQSADRRSRTGESIVVFCCLNRLRPLYFSRSSQWNENRSIEAGEDSGAALRINDERNRVLAGRSKIKGRPISIGSRDAIGGCASNIEERK